MSAYICNHETILTVAVAAAQLSNRAIYPSLQEVERMYTELLEQNVRSVNTRYGENDDPAVYARPISNKAIRSALALNPSEIHGAAKCLAYQSCETDDYYNTRAAAYAIWAKDYAAQLAFKALGYKDREWGVSEGGLAA